MPRIPKLVASETPRHLSPPPPSRAPKWCKVGEGWYAARNGWAGSERIPSLRLRGRWLADLGFEVGSQLRVTRSDGVITLEVVKG